MFSPLRLQHYILNLLNRCNQCKKVLDNTKEVIRDSLDGHTTLELSVDCGYCGSQVDYYAYGDSQLDCDQREFEDEYPRVAKLARRMVGK